MRRIFLIDCPGVVYPSGDSETDIVLKGVVRPPPLPSDMRIIQSCHCWSGSHIHELSSARSKLRRSRPQRTTLVRCWRGPRLSTSRRPTEFRLGRLPRISWKSLHSAQENSLRSGRHKHKRIVYCLYTHPVCVCVCVCVCMCECVCLRNFASKQAQCVTSGPAGWRRAGACQWELVE